MNLDNRKEAQPTVQVSREITTTNGYLQRVIKEVPISLPPFNGLIMKRLVLIASLLGFAVCMNPAIAKDTSEHLTAQQNKMSYCSKEAAAKDLHGDKRKEFMKECLSKKVDDGKKKLTKQQEKMVKCSKEAKEKALKGELRKKFMSDCLKN